MTEPKTVGMRLNVTPALYAELQALAEKHDVSLAHIIRRAIRFYLQSEQTP